MTNPYEPIEPHEEPSEPAEEWYGRIPYSVFVTAVSTMIIVPFAIFSVLCVFMLIIGLFLYG